jgi:hypothetical protein
MAFTRDQIRASIERAGDEHWQALIQHHTDAYPESNPTPGDVARAEAARRNDLGLGNDPNLELVESRVERVEPAVRITHVFEDHARGAVGSRRSRSPATNERGARHSRRHGRGRYLPAPSAVRCSATKTSTELLLAQGRCRRRPHRDAPWSITGLLLLVMQRGSGPGARDICLGPAFRCQLSARTPNKSEETGDSRRRDEGTDMADISGISGENRRSGLRAMQKRLVRLRPWLKRL